MGKMIGAITNSFCQSNLSLATLLHCSSQGYYFNTFVLWHYGLKFLNDSQQTKWERAGNYSLMLKSNKAERISFGQSSHQALLQQLLSAVTAPLPVARAGCKRSSGKALVLIPQSGS
jgi:hypothetical protein